MPKQNTGTGISSGVDSGVDFSDPEVQEWRRQNGYPPTEEQAFDPSRYVKRYDGTVVPANRYTLKGLGANRRNLLGENNSGI